MILLLIATVIAPINALAYQVFDSNNQHHICMFEEDNSNPQNIYEHCETCVYFFDCTDSNLSHSTSLIAYRNYKFQSTFHKSYHSSHSLEASSRSPPSA